MRTVTAVLATLVALVGTALAAALEVTLSTVQFPEKQTITVRFAATPRAPRGELGAAVEARAAQTVVDLEFARMRPAVLFAGDVTSYVVWAVTREGAYENLGELWVRDDAGSARLSTGLKEFAMIVTAEPHAMVDAPSELVVFISQPPEKAKGSRVTAVSFGGFAPAPLHDLESIADVEYRGGTPLDLLQAEKAFELAQRAGAEQLAAGLMREARLTLAQATALATAAGRRKEMVDFSRRTVSLASEALRTSTRRREEQALEQRIAARRAEMEALETRARGAEAAAAAAQGEIEQARATKLALEDEMGRLRQQRATLESANATLASANTALEEQKRELSQRLEGALSQVAETKSSARGFIVNLPDILFDRDQATLRPAAQLTIARLSGILLLMPELGVRVEGHTDATGSAAHNLALSQRRAEAVLAFLADNGIAGERLKAIGYGMEFPVADNASPEGRARNRRVELVIGEAQALDAAPR